jgi:hypothetical protein
MPLAEVAQRSGFGDQSHFSRPFKEQFHVSPGHYRIRRIRADGPGPPFEGGSQLKVTASCPDGTYLLKLPASDTPRVTFNELLGVVLAETVSIRVAFTGRGSLAHNATRRYRRPQIRFPSTLPSRLEITLARRTRPTLAAGRGDGKT